MLDSYVNRPVTTGNAGSEVHLTEPDCNHWNAGSEVRLALNKVYKQGCFKGKYQTHE